MLCRRIALAQLIQPYLEKCNAVIIRCLTSEIWDTKIARLLSVLHKMRASGGFLGSIVLATPEPLTSNQARHLLSLGVDNVCEYPKKQDDVNRLMDLLSHQQVEGVRDGGGE